MAHMKMTHTTILHHRVAEGVAAHSFGFKIKQIQPIFGLYQPVGLPFLPIYTLNLDPSLNY